MAAFTIPTIYSAIDKFTAPIRKMAGAHASFAGALERSAAHGERWFRKLTPALSETTKQFFSFASAAAIAGAVLGGINFTARQIIEYEDALASFRTIVGGTNEEFAKYEQAALRVGKANKVSAVEVTKSFETIAGLNAEFAKTPASIEAVANANIILSKASRMSLDESAANMVGIMNQFGLAAEESNRVINVLAAGQAVGAANISQTSEAFKNFGSVAKGANITLEQSVGLIQTLGKFSVFGAEAGTKLRGSVLKLQQAGLGYKSGQFQINDALEEARKKVDKLATSKQKDAAILKMFGAENISTGKILLNNVALFDQYTKGVTATDEAQKAAALNSGTFTAKLKALTATWTNMVLSSDQATSSLSSANKVIDFLIVNLGTIVTWGVRILLFFAAWKVILIATKVALVAYNIVIGITGALMGTASVAIGKSSIALGAYKIVLGLVTAAQWAWNVAMTANPIGLIIVGIGILIGVVAAIIYKWNEWGAVVSAFLGPLGLVISLIQSFRRNWDMISEAFSKGGILAGLKAIGKTIIDAVLMPMQKVAELLASLTGFDVYKNAAKSIEATRKAMGVNVTTDESGEALAPKPIVNPEASKQDAMVQRMESTNNARVDMHINDPGNRVKAESSSPLVNIFTSSTLKPSFGN
jgi:TP901 family phage tail tape measure protein